MRFAIALLVLVLPLHAQRTVIGNSTYDKVLPGFFGQNNNAGTTIQGLNQNAGTNRLADVILPALITGRTLSGQFTGTNSFQIRTYNSSLGNYQLFNFNFLGNPAAQDDTNTVSRVGAKELLSNKTLDLPNFASNGVSTTGIVKADGTSGAKFIQGKSGTNSWSIQSDLNVGTNALVFVDGVLVSGSPTDRLASTFWASNYIDNVNNAKITAGGLYFDWTVSGASLPFTLPTLDTNDYTIWVRFKCPETISVAAAATELFSVSGGLGKCLEARFPLASGALEFIHTEHSAASTRKRSISGVSGVVGGAPGGLSGKFTDLVITRSLGTLTIYLNGVVPAFSETTTGGAPPNFYDSITNTTFTLSDNSLQFSDLITAAAVFNRGLSPSDVTRLREAGVSYADQWAAQSAIVHYNPATLNGDFETLGGGGADVFASWSETTAGTSTVNNETGAPFAGTRSCRLDVDASDSNVSINATGAMTPGKRYRVTYYAKRGATVCYAGSSGATGDTAWTNTLSTSYAQFIHEFVAASANFGIRRVAPSASGSIFLDNVILQEIGAMLEPDLQVGIGKFIPDRSANKLSSAPAAGEMGGGVYHWRPRMANEMVVQKTYLHSEISSSANTTKLLELPPNCGILDVEFDREVAFNAGTIDVGTTASQTKFVNAAVATGTGKLLVDSGNKTSESATAFTNIWIKKSTATSSGQTTVRVRYVIRGS